MWKKSINIMKVRLHKSKTPLQAMGVSSLQRCRAAGYLTLIWQPESKSVEKPRLL